MTARRVDVGYQTLCPKTGNHTLRAFDLAPVEGSFFAL